QQSFAEGRIAEIESKLSNAQIIDVTKLDANGKVVFGATVEIEDADTGKTVVYQIVGEDEADIKAGRISIGSPIARAMIGKEAGDTVIVKAPGGDVEYEVISIQYI
ncbi:MAG: transcription elongation factor GreA, partial [Methylicorpusculum sp.]|nr:transcription elongation factor GreA [Methylicorpusculum sp.]